MNQTIYDDLVKQAMSGGKEGGLDKVNEYIDDYINKNPNTLEAYIVRSEFYTEIEAFEEALDDAEKAIKINPNEVTAYNNRGCIYVKSGGDINKGLNDFSKAITLDPNYVDAYGNRAKVYLNMGEMQKAIDDCNKAIKISPDKCEVAYFNRGLAYMNIDEPEKALDDYNNVIRLAPDNAEAYAKRGVINSQLGNTQGAISDYEEFLRLDPDNKNAGLVRDELEQLKSGTTSSSAESYEVVTAKKERKALLILSGIGFILGIIIGASSGNVLLGMWFGIGIGVALSYLPEIPGIFMQVFRRDGFVDAIKVSIGGGFVWFILFMLAGPIGLLVRVLKMNKQINNTN